MSKSQQGKIISQITKDKLSKAFSGNKNPRYIDGRSYEKYPLEYSKMKFIILARDKYICLKCHKNKERMDVHHRDHNKKNNTKDNLITLCHQCNLEMERKATYNYWIDYWQMYMERYLQGYTIGYIKGRIDQKQMDFWRIQ